MTKPPHKPRRSHSALRLRLAESLSARPYRRLRYHAEPRHGIIWLSPPGQVFAHLARSIVGSFKQPSQGSFVVTCSAMNQPFWQRNYYDRVVRNEAELNRTREYIVANPMLWDYDHENFARIPDPFHGDAWAWPEQNVRAQP